MNEVFLKEILNGYAETRAHEQQALRDREMEVIKAIPEIGIIRTRIIELAAENSRQIIMGKKDKSTSIKYIQSEIATLKAKIIELLLSAGFPRDYLELKYRCSECKDTGYVGETVKDKCNCLVQKLLNKSYVMSDIKELDTQNFDTFDPMVFPDTPLKEGKTTQRLYMLQLKDRMKDYATQFPHNKKKTLVYSGKTGLGKTFLLNCLARDILNKGHTVLRVTSYKLLEGMFQSSLSNQIDGRNIYNRLFEVDLLIIDDLGTETQRNNFTTETIFNILNERFIREKHTFISTNLSLPELRERYSDRITSRLFDTANTMLIRFMGEDIRIKPAKTQT